MDTDEKARPSDWYLVDGEIWELKGLSKVGTGWYFYVPWEMVRLGTIVEERYWVLKRMSNEGGILLRPFTGEEKPVLVSDEA